MKHLERLLQLIIILSFLSGCKNQLEESTQYLSAPPAPSDITVTPISASSLKVDWSGFGQTLVGFRIAYNQGVLTPPADCTEGTIISENEISGFSHTITGLTENRIYSIRVCAVNGNEVPDLSLPSALVTGTPSSYCLGDRLTDSPFANSSSGGDGAGTPYTICSPEQLKAIGDDSANWGANFNIESNINMENFSPSSITPIGTNIIPYSGFFDGKGFLITNFSVSGGNEVGLVGYSSAAATIEDLGLFNASIVGTAVVGGILGDSQGIIQRCFFQGSVTGVIYVGGIAGRTSTSMMTEVYSLGTVSGDQWVGGVTGYAFSAVTNSYSNSIVSENNGGGDRIGGFAGDNTTLTLNNYATGDVIAPTSQNVGGFIGKQTWDADESFATGSIVGDGGFGNNLFGGSFSTGTNRFFDSTASCTGTCTDSATGPNIDGSTGIDTSVNPGYFYDSANLPMSTWNFVNIWQENANDYPSLRRVPELY